MMPIPCDRLVCSTSSSLSDLHHGQRREGMTFGELKLPDAAARHCRSVRSRTVMIQQLDSGG